MIAARTSSNPGLLKPSSHLVSAALDGLHADPGSCTLAGDSAGDIHAARAADVTSVGYATSPACIDA